MKLEEISFCGINFGHSKWHSHSKKCEICKNEIEELKNKEILLIENWSKECECGCGKITKYENTFICGHSQKGKKQTAEHKLNRVESWVENGNKEKYSEKWKNNNPSKSDKNRRRLLENNPSKTELVKNKISINNGMKSQKNIDKIKETKLEKYGDENYNNHEKWKINFLNKYGVDNPAKHKEFLEARISTYTTNLANGKYKIKNNWKCGNYININNISEWYDSSYELIKMVEYDDKKLNWTKKHGIKIPFIKENGLNSFYVPDFLIIIDGFNVLVETKGWV